MSAVDLGPIWLTLQLAGITTIILFFIAIPIAYWLAYTSWKGRMLVETLLSLPLVLPPTVLGFYLLLCFSPNSWLGQFLDNTLSFRIVFTFSGLVLGSIIYSLPFMVYPIVSGFRGLPTSLKEAAATLGKSEWTTLLRVLLPNIKVGLITGCILTFAHTVGEFGVVLMIGGNIPGKTRVASISIYDAVEAMEYDRAHYYAFILFILSFVILLLIYWSNQRSQQKVWL